MLKSAAALAGAATWAIVRPDQVVGSQANSRVKLGVIGCGGRGDWIAKLFAENGGYEMHAVADYFQEVADACGDALGVDKSRRFSGLSGYEKLIASGVEAVALETPPYCFPQHARAAVEAGLHVYMAKPVAVDVPGTLEIGELGKKAREKKQCFLVDFQVPTEPSNIEAVRRTHEGAIGRIVMVSTCYLTGRFPDPPKTKTIASRLRKLVWVNDTDIGASYHGNACIHGIDAGLWVLRHQRPVAAQGVSSIGRANPNGDSHDQYSISFEFADGTIMNHIGSHLNYGFRVRAIGWGQDGHMEIGYGGQAIVRGGKQKQEYVSDDAVMLNLYKNGAVRNIATFHKSILAGDSSNPTVEPSVTSTLVTMLGREAAARRAKLTMDELIREGKRLEPDLTGLQA
jgi:predicted dehydrogenase